MEGIIKIKKAKLTPMVYLEEEFSESIRRDQEVFRTDAAKKCFWTVHPDLTLKLAELKFHLAWLCEQIPQAMLREMGADHPDLSLIKVTGFVIGGDGDHEGVTLIGRRILKKNRVLNLVSPFTKWNDEHNPYEYASDLEDAIAACSEEVIQYLDGKVAPDQQLTLQFEEQHDLF